MTKKKAVIQKEGLISRLLVAFNVKENKKLAEILDVKESTITSWKDGDNIPQYEKILQKTELKGINLHWLLTGNGEMFVKNMQAKSHEERDYEELGRAVHEVYRKLRAINGDDENMW
ncbi:MAG: helix-turn-helix domain-containing protein [Chlorobiales bacterium]|nr:helix-turn-helix domain-containing protein [Chlorobiales bacterium]